MEEVATLPPLLLSISVVSHGQMALIAGLMQDIQRHCRTSSIEFILTLNIDEPLTLHDSDFFYPVKIVKNLAPKGFGANHNHAFEFAQGQYFCVINPDIRFESDPFPELFKCFENEQTGVVAPMVFGPSGELEDSVRRFPTPSIIFLRSLGQQKKTGYSVSTHDAGPVWVGGMFMLFPSHIFQQLHGFDERYFMYYEDVELCGRLQLVGYSVAVCTGSQVVHHARRTSHRSLKYLRWHLASMLRFFLSPVYRQLKASRGV
jgi:GT2 family glycosyltransferase